MLANINRAAGDRIVSTDTYQWNCFGVTAECIDYKDTDGYVYASAVFDTASQEVYYISLEIPGQQQAFQWINPERKDAYYKECKSRSVDPNIAWDTCEFTQIDNEETILTYMKDIGEGYYDDLPIPDEKMTMIDTSFTVPMPGTIGGATLVFNTEEKTMETTETKKTYTVNLDLRLVLEVKSDSMDDALAQAKHWQKTTKMNWGEGKDICWMDSYIVKESVESRSEW